MRELEVLDRGHLKLEWEERKAFFEEELDGHVRSEVKRLLEEALDAERTSRVAVGRYVRDVETRCDFRNGYYRRDLGTRLGLLRGLRIPRARRGYKSELLPRYQRRQESVHGLVREAFLRGISTRQVGPVLEPVVGEAYSAQTISRIARGLDAAVEKFHRRALGDEYVYLFLDGVVLKVRDAEINCALHRFKISRGGIVIDPDSTAAETILAQSTRQGGYRGTTVTGHGSEE